MGFFTDWGGFETFVAELHKTGHVSVEPNVKLKDRHGIERQIDVLITHERDLYKYLVIVECKHLNRPIERTIVDALANSVRELNASKGVIFTTKGFQSGAVSAAKAYGIELYKVREPCDTDWLFASRHVEVYGQRIGRAIGKAIVSIRGSRGTKYPSSITFTLASVPPEFCTPLDPQSPATFLTGFEVSSFFFIKRDIANHGFVFDIKDDVVRLFAQYRLDWREPVELPARGGTILVSAVQADMIVRIQQVRLSVDQASAYQFMVALDELVSGKTTYAFRGKFEQFTKYASDRPQPPDGHALRNGVVMHYYDMPLLDFPTELRALGGKDHSHGILHQAFPAHFFPGWPEELQFVDAGGRIL